MATQESYTVGGRAPVESAPAGGSPAAWPPVGDPTFWHESAPQAVRAYYVSGDAAGGWKRWQRHLVTHWPRKLVRRVSAWADAAKWDESPAELAARAEVWLAKPPASARPSAQRSTNGDATHAPSEARNGDAAPANGDVPHAADQSAAAYAEECVAWAHRLLARIDLFDPKLWWRVLERLHRVAVRPSVSLDEEPLAQQLLSGELPFTLACFFPELELCRRLTDRAARSLSIGVAELLDGEGLPQCRYLGAFHPLVACWVRCRMLASYCDQVCWDDDAEQQFPLALREAVRLTRPNGSPALADFAIGPEPAAAGDWLESADELCKAKPIRRLLRAAAAKQGERSKELTEARHLPPPAVHSEWAELAVLQSDWSPRSDRLTVTYGSQSVRIELAVGGELLASGRWELDVRANGLPVEPQGDWEEVCWVSDDECDYLEIEMQLSGGLRVQRQTLLARSDEFLFLSDSILGDEPCGLTYRGRLPLAPGISIQPTSETRELTLHGRRPRALVLPLALPEWRSDSRGGMLVDDAATIELRQTARGCRLFAPLWIDLAGRRLGKPLTWRQLTVAQTRRNLPRDEAVGYRVQIGKRQWLVYRSLCEPANRTVLGHNLATDFLLAQFHRDGSKDVVLEIE